MGETVPQVAVIVLAAGAGTRMKSRTPKPLHPLAGRPLIAHVLSTAGELHPVSIVTVVRHERDRMADTVGRIRVALTSAFTSEGNQTRISAEHERLRGEIARRVIPGVWIRPVGSGDGEVDDHLHLDLGYTIFEATQ